MNEERWHECFTMGMADARGPCDPPAELTALEKRAWTDGWNYERDQLRRDGAFPVARHVAVHEAGHAIVADALGFDVVHIVEDDVGHATGFTAPDDPTPHECFALSAITLAGGLAQDRIGTEPDAGCLEDLNIAATLVKRYLGDDHTEADVDATLHRASSLAGNILAARFTDVLRLADIVESTGAATSEQIAEIVRLYREGDTMEIHVMEACES